MTGADTALARGYIRPEIAHNAVPIGDVSAYPGNARKGNIDKIKRSLVKHGQYKELLVQASTGYVMVGNNTLAAMAELGYTDVAVLRLDVDDTRARELLLIDNASSDGSDYDKAALAELLAGVSDWDGTGWDPDDLDDLLAGLEQAGGDAAAVLAGLPDAPRTLTEVPATDASYAETPEAEQARRDSAESRPPRYTKGLAELILTLPDDDKAEVNRLVDAAREWLGKDLKTHDAVLRGLRTLAAVGDSRHQPNATITVRSLMKAAGYTEEPPL